MGQQGGGPWTGGRISHTSCRAGRLPTCLATPAGSVIQREDGQTANWVEFALRSLTCRMGCRPTLPPPWRMRCTAIWLICGRTNQIAVRNDIFVRGDRPSSRNTCSHSIWTGGCGSGRRLRDGQPPPLLACRPLCPWHGLHAELVHTCHVVCRQVLPDVLEVTVQPINK